MLAKIHIYIWRKKNQYSVSVCVYIDYIFHFFSSFYIVFCYSKTYSNPWHLHVHDFNFTFMHLYFKISFNTFITYACTPCSHYYKQKFIFKVYSINDVYILFVYNSDWGV